jgi:hypothetical protein
MSRRDRAELTFDRQSDIIREYERGFAGAYKDQAAHDRLCQHIEDIGGYADGGMACRAAGFEGTGAGKLSLPFIAAMQLYPGVLPGGRQLRGDCVSWSSRTTGLVSYCASLLYGPNNLRNDAPIASAKAIANGLFSSESYYWYRGYDGDGWSCDDAADVAMKQGGLVLRQNYPELGINLEAYSPSTAGRWGRTPPPAEVRSMTQTYLIQNATVCKTYEQVRDMLAQGYAVSTCGGESWSFTRDSNGVCSRTNQGWAHAIAAVAVDDRDETKKKYGSPLIALQNSWDEYMTGGRRILGTDLEIPPGAFWSRWDDCHSRSFIAFSTGKGWTANSLPDWGLGGIV